MDVRRPSVTYTVTLKLRGGLGEPTYAFMDYRI